MDAIMSLLYGFGVSCEPMNLFYCVSGVVFGVLVGALPGLGPSAGIAILLPLTYSMTPVGGIIMLAGIYYGAMYGGSITSILINTPGDSAAVVTLLDGFPLAQQGKPGKALGMAAIASILGGSISLLIFTFLAPALARFALSFGPPEFCALMLMGLTAIGGMTGKYPLKGYLAALIGLFLGVIGLDTVSGASRFIFFGNINLYEGLDFVPVAMGLFGVAEIISTASENKSIVIKKEDISWRKQMPNGEDMRHSTPHILRGTALGFFIGMLPGAGATIASFMSYSMAKKTSKRGDLFGTGVVEGIAAPESANNAASMGALVPMLTLGIPGSAATAMMLGALLMFDMKPGPMLFTNNPDFVWGLISSMYLGNVILLIIAMLFLPVFVRVLNVRRPVLNAVVMAFILIGAYCLKNSMFTVGLTIFFGVLGFLMKKLEIPAAPLVLALVLGTLMEYTMRQSLIISSGDPMIFFSRPISGAIMIIAVLMLFWPMLIALRQKLRNRDNA